MRRSLPDTVRAHSWGARGVHHKRHPGGDAWLDGMAARLAAQLGDTAPDPAAGTQAIIATSYRLGETTLKFFSTLSQFSTAEDIALADWQIEHLFPADEATREVLVAMGAW